jgi:hypothetical protein
MDTPGSTGDDAPATDAQLDQPYGVAVTADSGFLIANMGNNVVRKVSAGGVITRVAGTTGTIGGNGTTARPPTPNSTVHSCLGTRFGRNRWCGAMTCESAGRES